MKARAVMFDLDGTLADTLADIAAAGNHALARLGRPARPVADYRYLAGQGLRQLVIDALGDVQVDADADADDPRIDAGIAAFRAYYSEHDLDHTRPFEGIPDLLDALARDGVPMAVLSNKPDPATRRLVEQIFSRWPFVSVRGQRDDTPLKPDPAAARLIAEHARIPLTDWLYVGDTAVDMRTAVNAGMVPVGCRWGFRDEAELLAHGAVHLVSHPMEILDLLDAADPMASSVSAG